LFAEPLERRPEQWGEEPGRPFEGELGCVDHLGAALNAAEGHGVDGGERLVLPWRRSVTVAETRSGRSVNRSA
jgi:hypothetical protein